MAAPLTPFEDRGRVAPWTTRQEGDDWLDVLIDYAGGRIRKAIIGQSEGGLPVAMHSLGSGDRHVLYVCQQHGTELSGREAMLTRLRQWADDTTPELDAYLAEVTINVIVTSHPDNFTTRENINGVNINRDHITLSQGETLAIAAAIRDTRPDLIVDLHEGANIANEFASSPTKNPVADSAVWALSHQLDTLVRTAIEQAGHTWESYQGNNIAGPEYLHNAATLHGAVGLLLETRRVYGNDSDVAARHDLQLLAVNALHSWHMAETGAVAATVDAARNRVAHRAGTVTLATGTSGTGPAVDIPVAYRLTPQQREEFATHLDRFVLTDEMTGETFRVPTSQDAQSLLLYAADPDSHIRVITAEREENGPHPGLIPGGTPIGYRIKLDGATLEAQAGYIGTPAGPIRVFPAT